VPPRRRPTKPVRVVLGEEEQEGERARQRELAEVAGDCDRLQDVPAFDRALELTMQRPLRRHEQMFDIQAAASLPRGRSLRGVLDSAPRMFRKRGQWAMSAAEAAKRDVYSWVPPSGASRLTALLAALICIGAGIYLATHESATGETTWFEILARGIGIYFIGKGIFVGSTLIRQQEQITLLQRLVELSAWHHQRETERLPQGAPSSGASKNPRRQSPP
jgi:hypothetical protein